MLTWIVIAALTLYWAGHAGLVLARERQVPPYGAEHDPADLDPGT